MSATMLSKRFRYHYRPGYKSDKLLIEFLTGVDDADFIPSFMNAICELNPQLTGTLDLWMNDEVQLEFNSSLGAFTFSKDIWGFAFLEANKNQECLKKINSLLANNDRFEKEEVDFDKYK